MVGMEDDMAPFMGLGQWIGQWDEAMNLTIAPPLPLSHLPLLNTISLLRFLLTTLPQPHPSLASHLLPPVLNLT